ncbi:replication initiation and membrane attachment family protein [Brochothrix thermosphacta]|uniref:replication initiation and membrane attachment family protein n=1 Tax=Brochothrix thermosphacta TaxID=2756 RepID=UPI000D791FD5|nr:DnaD domain protein [Brochothrix thermosphacta]SPN75844.1 putative helicase DnaB; chromosome replication initiation and membrane attachment protein [Brochothrix thermosphacta]
MRQHHLEGNYQPDPGDSYVIETVGLLNDIDRRVLTQLYLPLINVDAYTLYQTFFDHVPTMGTQSEKQTHYQLQTLLADMSQTRLIKARLVLEGVRLLKSFVVDKGDSRHYVYELAPPMDPYHFFNDGVLNLFLFSAVGDRRYRVLKNNWVKTETDKSEMTEITTSFTEVFQFPKTKLTAEAKADTDKLVGRSQATQFDIPDSRFDFERLYSKLSPTFITLSAINDEVKETIRKLYAVYHISEDDMVSLIYRAMQSDGNVDLEQLRKVARDFYQINMGEGAYPKLKVKEPEIQTVDIVQSIGDIQNEGQLIEFLTQIDTFNLIKELSTYGADPTIKELEAVETVMSKRKMPIPVMNALIYYTRLQGNGIDSPEYMEKIARDWDMKGVVTVADVIQSTKAFVDKKQEDYEKWQQRQNNSYRKTDGKANDIIPDWLQKQLAEEDGVTSPAAAEKPVEKVTVPTIIKKKPEIKTDPAMLEKIAQLRKDLKEGR